MRVVNVGIKGIKVNSFSLKDSTVLLEIFFNDGANKQIYRTTEIKDPKQEAEEIVSEIIRLEENINLKFNGAKIEGDAKVIVENEEQTRKRVTQMLSEIQSKIERIKSKKSANGYMELVAEINRTEMSLE